MPKKDFIVVDCYGEMIPYNDETMYCDTIEQAVHTAKNYIHGSTDIDVDCTIYQSVRVARRDPAYTKKIKK